MNLRKWENLDKNWESSNRTLILNCQAWKKLKSSGKLLKMLLKGRSIRTGKRCPEALRKSSVWMIKSDKCRKSTRKLTIPNCFRRKEQNRSVNLSTRKLLLHTRLSSSWSMALIQRKVINKPQSKLSLCKKAPRYLNQKIHMISHLLIKQWQGFWQRRNIQECLTKVSR